jgi:hypothetical protein
MNKAIHNLTGLLVALTVFGCARTNDGPTDPGQWQPELFAPKTISTGNVYRGAFTPDGQSFYFFKNVREGQEDYRIFRSIRVGARWSDPVQISLGGDYSDLYPTISPDGERIVYSSYRPAPGDTSSAPNANLWYADWRGDDWGPPVFMAAASTLSNYDAKPAFGPGDGVYFDSVSPDWSTRRSLVTYWDGEGYAEPEVFEAVEQWRHWRPDLYVWGGVPAPDGRFIIFDVSEKDPDTGRALTSNQWISLHNADSGWTEPERLGSGLNNEGYDNFTFFSADGSDLFFVRDFDQFYRMPVAQVLQSVR